MKRFAALYLALDRTASTGAKLHALREYLVEAAAEDAAWALYFLSGRKLARVINSPRLRSWTAESLHLPPAAVEESYAQVGDLAETLALLWDLAVSPASSQTQHEELPLSIWVARLEALRGLDEPTQRDQLLRWWSELPARERFLLNKLLTGSLRVGVSTGLVIRALAAHAGLPEPLMAQRLMGDWIPSAAWYAQVIAPTSEGGEAIVGAPYPFCLASPLDAEPATLGAREDFLAEWKWDGIRAQLIRRAGQSFVWSRGEELMNDRFPEIEQMLSTLPDGTVLDGEVLAWKNDAVAPFALLQRRIGRKRVGAKLLADAPVTFLAYDLLEWRGEDWRARPLSERRAKLEWLADCPLQISQELDAKSWTELASLRESSRSRGVEGLMLKRLDSEYRAGRRRGSWWKWKIGAMTIDCVLVYAQSGHGRRASLYTDYTLAVWDGAESGEGALVPVAKAYSGLTDIELQEMDSWIRRHTREKFGPVRSVQAGRDIGQVFEIAFEGIQASPRHKSGIALRFPRIARWRKDKPAHEADTLIGLKRWLLPAQALPIQN